MSDFAIATTSWIRTNEERKIVLDTFTSLDMLGFPIFVADAGSSAEDQKQIQAFKNVIFFEEKGGLTQQLLLVHKKAAKVAPAVFYLQSDKNDFAKRYISEMITYYKKTQRNDILIASRTKESLETYPSFQKIQEEFLNFFMSDAIGIEHDYYAGPKIYPSSLINYVDLLKIDVGWGVEAFLYGVAKRLNTKFDFYDVFIQAPKDIDTEEQTKHYRLRITEQQIQAFLYAQQADISNY